MSKTIPLSRGLSAIVDDDMYETLAKHKWYVTCRGYVVRITVHRMENGQRTFGRTVYMHREVLPGHKLVDHINRIKTDNRRENLRTADKSINAINTAWHRTNTSGFRNVHWNRFRNKWTAQVQRHGKNICLGAYATKAEAIKARNEWFRVNQ